MALMSIEMEERILKLKQMQQQVKNSQKCVSYPIKELEITKILTKYTLVNKEIDYSFLLSSLNILLHLSEILRNRLNQEV